MKVILNELRLLHTAKAAESLRGCQQFGKGQTDSLYHTGDEKKDRSEARLLIDFRKATGPTHTHTQTHIRIHALPLFSMLTHTYTHPRRQACNSVVHRVRQGLVTRGIPLLTPDVTAGLDTCLAWRGENACWSCACVRACVVAVNLDIFLLWEFIEHTSVVAVGHITEVKRLEKIFKFPHRSLFLLFFPSGRAWWVESRSPYLHFLLQPV